VLQSVAATNGEFSILSIVISIGIVGVFIGSILYLGSRSLPKVIDKVGRTNDYALMLIVILGLACV
jgi:CPA2 family monovalent cation:H+ antiporter-2